MEQTGCAASVAFVSTAVVETCYKKLTGKFSTSQRTNTWTVPMTSREQLPVPGLRSMSTWLAIRQKLVDGVKYPYKLNCNTCPGSNMLSYVSDLSFLVKNAYFTYSGT